MLTDPQLKSKVDALWDRFWSGGIANAITAIESRAAFRQCRSKTAGLKKRE
jgi:type I restriction enzyme M protein